MVDICRHCWGHDEIRQLPGRQKTVRLLSWVVFVTGPSTGSTSNSDWAGQAATATCARSPATTAAVLAELRGSRRANVLVALRSLFAFCKKHKTIFRNPVQGLRVGQHPYGIIQPLR